MANTVMNSLRTGDVLVEGKIKRVRNARTMTEQYRQHDKIIKRPRICIGNLHAISKIELSNTAHLFVAVHLFFAFSDFGACADRLIDVELVPCG